MKKIFISMICMFVFAGCTRYTGVVESGETLNNWQIARDYQAQGRFELARQYYTLSLASARTPNSQAALQEQIEAVDRQIQAMR